MRGRLLPIAHRQACEHLSLAGETAVEFGTDEREVPADGVLDLPAARLGLLVVPDVHRFGRREEGRAAPDAVGPFDPHGPWFRVRSNAVGRDSVLVTYEPCLEFDLGSDRKRSRASSGAAVERRDKPRLVGLHFAKALDRADRQLDLAHDRLALADQAHAAAADLERSVLLVRELTQRVPHAIVEIDIRGPLAAEIDIERLRLEVDAGVDAAATAESLEAEHAAAAGDNGIEREGIEGLVEAGANRVAQHGQHLPDNRRPPQFAVKKQVIRRAVEARRHPDVHGRRCRLDGRLERVTIGIADGCAGHWRIP